MIKAGCNSSCPFERNCLSKVDVTTICEMTQEFWGSPKEVFSLSLIFSINFFYMYHIYSGFRSPKSLLSDLKQFSPFSEPAKPCEQGRKKGRFVNPPLKSRTSLENKKEFAKRHYCS